VSVRRPRRREAKGAINFAWAEGSILAGHIGQQLPVAHVLIKEENGRGCKNGPSRIESCDHEPYRHAGKATTSAVRSSNVHMRQPWIPTSRPRLRGQQSRNLKRGPSHQYPVCRKAPRQYALNVVAIPDTNSQVGLLSNPSFDVTPNPAIWALPSDSSREFLDGKYRTLWYHSLQPQRATGGRS